MKGLYKKISAIVLAGMVVLGGGVLGGALGGVQKVDAFSWLEIKKDFGSDYRFVEKVCDEFGVKILFSSKNPDEVDKFVKKRFKNKSIVKRLLDLEISFESQERNEFKSYIKKISEDKKAKKAHRIQFGEMEYILLFK